MSPSLPQRKTNCFFLPPASTIGLGARAISPLPSSSLGAPCRCVPSVDSSAVALSAACTCIPFHARAVPSRRLVALRRADSPAPGFYTARSGLVFLAHELSAGETMRIWWSVRFIRRFRFIFLSRGWFSYASIGYGRLCKVLTWLVTEGVGSNRWRVQSLQYDR